MPHYGWPEWGTPADGWAPERHYAPVERTAGDRAYDELVAYVNSVDWRAKPPPPLPESGPLPGLPPPEE